MVFKIILAIVAGYLLGSIPTAYLVTRAFKGKDIRRLGGGNIGTLNTMKSVGKLPAAIVMVVDIGKGAAAVIVAHYPLNLEPPFVMLAGIMAVVGHLWMIFLKFSGGRGMGAAIGAVLATLAIYGEWTGMGIFAVLIFVPLFITWNIPLAMCVAFLGLPFIAWFVAHSTSGTILSVILGLLVGGKFLPTAIAAWKKAKTRKEFFFGERKQQQPDNNSKQTKDHSG